MVRRNTTSGKEYYDMVEQSSKRYYEREGITKKANKAYDLAKRLRR